jgi:hypothetical protein
MALFEVKVLGFEDDTRAASCVELYFWNIQGLLEVCTLEDCL